MLMTERVFGGHWGRRHHSAFISPLVPFWREPGPGLNYCLPPTLPVSNVHFLWMNLPKQRVKLVPRGWILGGTHVSFGLHYDLKNFKLAADILKFGDFT